MTLLSLARSPVEQFRMGVVRPALQDLGVWSLAAENLVLGTAAAESGFRFLAQVGGPALGLWQVEPKTHDSIWKDFLAYRKPLAGQVMVAAGRGTKTPRKPPDEWLIYNLRYAAAICRVRYLMDPEPLPSAFDVEALGNYWKRVYNTRLGAGTVEHFVSSYQRLVNG